MKTTGASISFPVLVVLVVGALYAGQGQDCEDGDVSQTIQGPYVTVSYVQGPRGQIKSETTYTIATTTYEDAVCVDVEYDSVCNPTPVPYKTHKTTTSILVVYDPVTAETTTFPPTYSTTREGTHASCGC